MKDKDIINGLMIPLIFMIGVLGTGVILVIALGCIENGSTAMGIFIAIISIARLFTNHITDSSVYKK